MAEPIDISKFAKLDTMILRNLCKNIIQKYKDQFPEIENRYIAKEYNLPNDLNLETLEKGELIAFLLKLNPCSAPMTENVIKNGIEFKEVKLEQEKDDLISKQQKEIEELKKKLEKLSNDNK